MKGEDRIVRFQGIIEEIKCIAVDYFRDLNAGAYFLSHCHADHMAGLNSAKLFNYVRSSGVKIYCSAVSKNMLSHWADYNHLVEHLEPLEVNCPYSLDVQNRDGSHKASFCVTLLSSGHCPGSVMFLFEGKFGNILYTGDFRLGIGDGSRITALREDPRRKNSPLKQLDHVYLDCTFCFPKAETLPLRPQVLLEMAKVIESWLRNGSEHHVLLSTSARFGSEFLFVEIFEKLKMQIHVSEDKYEMYKNIKVLRRAITKDGRSTKIHSCLDKGVFNQVNTLPCFGDKRKAKICMIRATTQWHLWKGHSEVVVRDREMYRVLYSMHSSLQEIQDFVQNLKPKRITPISKPDDVTVNQIQALLNCTVTSPALYICVISTTNRMVVSDENGKVQSVTSESETKVQKILEEEVPSAPCVPVLLPVVQDRDSIPATSSEGVVVQNGRSVEPSTACGRTYDTKAVKVLNANCQADAEVKSDLVLEPIATSSEYLTAPDIPEANGPVKDDSSRTGGPNLTVAERDDQSGPMTMTEKLSVELRLREVGLDQSERGCRVENEQAASHDDDLAQVEVLSGSGPHADVMGLEEDAESPAGQQSGSQSSIEVIDIVTVETGLHKTPDKTRNSSSLEFEFDSPSLFEVGRHEAVYSQCKRKLDRSSDGGTSAKVSCPDTKTGGSLGSTEDVITID